MKTESTASWTYGTATWRSFNNSDANRVEVIVGVAEENVDLIGRSLVAIPAVAEEYGVIGIDKDGNSSNDADIIHLGATKGAAIYQTAEAHLKDYPAAGYHYYQMTEHAFTTTNITFYGTSGLIFKYGLIGLING